MIKRFFCDKDGNIVIWQWPNLLLWIWIITSVFAQIVPGKLHGALSLLASLMLIIWAGLELAWGDSPFRRCLGAGVGALAVAHLLLKFS